MDKQKKILFIDHDSRNTGATVSLLYILKKFYEADFIVTVLTNKNADNSKIFTPYASEIYNLRKIYNLNVSQSNTLSPQSLKGIYTVFLIGLRSISGFFAGLKYIRSIKPDIVYINEYVMTQFAYAARWLSIPVVLHVRSLFYKCKWESNRRLLKKFIEFPTKAIIGITDLEIKQFLPVSHDKKKNFYVVGEFLSKEDFSTTIVKSVLREKYQIPQTAKVILMLGGFNVIKGTYEFIKAAQEVISKRKDTHFMIVGHIAKSDKEKKRYTEMCLTLLSDYNLESKILVIAEVADTSEYISTSDVIVSSNTTSHFSRPIIEAWARKKPVIASDHPHSRNLIKHMSNGLLYKKGIPQSLSNAILLLVGDENLCIKFGENGYRKVLKQFDNERNTEKIVGICEKLINRKND